MAQKKITQQDIMTLLDAAYAKSADGIHKVSPPVKELADEYLNKYKDPKVAAKKLIDNQVLKCTTSGFVTGLGGAITLPVAIPANISSVLYVQIRMVTAVAYLAGLDVKSDQTQSFVYACVAGLAISSAVKKAGAEIGEKVAVAAIKKIPGKVLVKINKKVGTRLLTKFGEKGVVNLGKLVPGVGAAIGGTLDFAETKIIGNRALKMFFDGDFDFADEKNVVKYEDVEEIVDIEYEDVSNDEEGVIDITAPLE